MLNNQMLNNIYGTMKLLKEQAQKLVGNEDLVQQSDDLLAKLRIVGNIDEDFTEILRVLLAGLNCIYAVAEHYIVKDHNFLGTIEIAIARRSRNKVLAFELLTNGRQLMDHLTEVVVRNGGKVYLFETIEAIDKEISRLRGL